MGEARRRRLAAAQARGEAYATGKPFKPTPRCPACQSTNVRRMPVAQQPPFIVEMFGSIELEICVPCQAVWEAFPAEGYVEDPVCAEPCDNCAFRPGSPEQQDREGWKALIAKLRPGGDGWFADHFYCHKGVPIDMSKGPGNFRFPEVQVTADGQPVFNPDGSPVMTWDTTRMRTCSGFLRMFWRLSDKAEAQAEGQVEP